MTDVNKKSDHHTQYRLSVWHCLRPPTGGGGGGGSRHSDAEVFGHAPLSRECLACPSLGLFARARLAGRMRTVETLSV